jgi:uncharacterized protein YndB with AHSA1/START domain
MMPPMPTESLRLAATFPVPPERLYQAWLDSREHAAFTGGAAAIEPTVGGAHSSWDGYIWGRFLELDPGRRILATWRTSEFPPGADDSRLEITFEPSGGGTRVTIVHTEIPEGHAARYEVSWEDFYFDPMRKYFTAPPFQANVATINDAAVATPRARATRARTRGGGKPARAARPSRQAARKKTATKRNATERSRRVRKVAKKSRKPATSTRKPAKKGAKRLARKAAGRTAKRGHKRAKKPSRTAKRR